MNSSMYKNFIGKKVNLFPGDTHYREAIIENVDELGWTFKITCAHYGSGCTNGDVLFYNHASRVIFKFIKD